jgi:hypothetical protein
MPTPQFVQGRGLLPKLPPRNCQRCPTHFGNSSLRPLSLLHLLRTRRVQALASLSSGAAKAPGTDREVKQFHPVVGIKQIFAKNDVQFFLEVARNQVEARKNGQQCEGRISMANNNSFSLVKGKVGSD